MGLVENDQRAEVVMEMDGGVGRSKQLAFGFGFFR